MVGKLWNLLKITLSVCVFAFLIFSGILFYLSGRAEGDYQKAFAYAASSDWENALKTVEGISHYKKASELYSYIYPIKMYYNKFDSPEATIENYKKILFYIQTEKDNIGKLGDEKYIKDITDLEKVIAFNTNVFNVRAQSETVTKNLNDAVAFLKNGEFDKALEKLNAMGKSSYDSERDELVKFIALQKTITLNDQKLILQEVAKLNPSYSGIYSAEIKQVVQAYANAEKWNELYTKALGTPKQNEVVQASPANEAGGTATPPVPVPPPNFKIAVDMKREEIVAALGNPTGSKVIESRFGTFEEMVYGERTAYLENGKVVAVK